MSQNSVLNIGVSMFENYRSPEPKKTINLLKWLKTDWGKEAVEIIRTTKDAKEKNTLKSKLPAVTVSGVFSYRAKSKLVQHSGLICLDIDYKPDENSHIINFSELGTELAKIENVAYCGLSVGGKGYFVIIPLAYSDKHEQQFDQLKEDFYNLGIIVDKSCRDVSRLRGYSVDVNGYYNHTAIPYTGLMQPKKREYKAFKRSGNNEDVEYLISQICARNVDIAPAESDWYSLGCAFANEYGEVGRSYFHAVSQFYPKYDYSQADKKYSSCLKRNSNATIATFFHFCKRAGILAKERYA